MKCQSSIDTIYLFPPWKESWSRNVSPIEWLNRKSKWNSINFYFNKTSCMTAKINDVTICVGMEDNKAVQIFLCDSLVLQNRYRIVTSHYANLEIVERHRGRMYTLILCYFRMSVFQPNTHNLFWLDFHVWRILVATITNNDISYLIDE